MFSGKKGPIARAKNQLISKCPFGVSVWTKILIKIWQISALEFEKWSNHMITAH